MKATFYKYQATGNDFIIFDNRNNSISFKDKQKIIQLCDRKFGIGSDGLMLLNSKPGYDFEVVFYNPDASMSLCGNGSRCIVAFAKFLNIINHSARFIAIDGEHTASFIEQNWISLKMNDVKHIERGEGYWYLNTGSPHYCLFVDNIETVNVVEEGRKIRYNPRFSKEGTNVNFLQYKEGALHVRTYERGVENETLSCGTGVTASALVASINGIVKQNFCHVVTRGGKLKVQFNPLNNEAFTEIYLQGPAEFVFKGEIDLK